MTIAGSSHGLGSSNLLWQCYDASASPTVIQPEGVSVHPSTGEVVVRFATPQTGTILLTAVPLVVASGGTGITFGKTTDEYSAVAGQAVLGLGRGLLPAGVRIHGVTLRVLTTFGATQGLSTLAVGGLTLSTGWGTGIARTAGTLSTLAATWRTDLPITSTVEDVTLTAENGLFDGTGAARLTVHWSQLVPD